MRWLLLAILLCGCTTQNLGGNAVLLTTADEVAVGDTVQLQLRITDVEDLAGAQFSFLYDPELLEYLGATPGTFLGNPDLDEVYFHPPNSSSSGLLDNLLIVRTKLPGRSGSGTLATITFRSLSEGTASFAFSNVVLSNSGAAEIPMPSLGTELTIFSDTADAEPPRAVLIYPEDGMELRGTADLAAAASDNVEVVGLQFLINGATLGDEARSAPYLAEWDTTSVPDGSYTITALSRDAAGNAGESPPARVTVRNSANGDTTPPTVAITSPSAGQLLNGKISVTAIAADDVGVTGISFYLDGEPLGAPGEGPTHSVSWHTKGGSPGPHVFAAVATDAAANQGSAAVTAFIPQKGRNR